MSLYHPLVLTYAFKHILTTSTRTCKMPRPNTKSSGRYSKWRNTDKDTYSAWDNQTIKPPKAGRRNQSKKSIQDTQQVVTFQDTTSGLGNTDPGWGNLKAALTDAQTSWGNSQPTQSDPPFAWDESKPGSGNSQSWVNVEESKSAPVTNDEWGRNETPYLQKTPEEIAEEKKKARLKAEHREMIQKLWEWPWKNAPPQLVTLVGIPPALSCCQLMN